MATIQLTPSSSALLSGSVSVVNVTEVSGASTVNLTSSGVVERVGDLSAASSVAVASTGTIDRVGDLAGASTVAVSSDAYLQSVLDMYGESTVVVRSSAYLEGEQLEVWATTVDGKVSRYEGFNFTSFVTVGGKTYGLNDAGLFELSGMTDNGAAIKWFLQSAPARADVGMLLPYQAYVVGLIPADTELFVLNDREEVFDYDLRDTSNRLDSVRRRLGLGLRTRHFAYGLYGKAISEGSLSTVTVMLNQSKRNV